MSRARISTQHCQFLHFSAWDREGKISIYIMSPFLLYSHACVSKELQCLLSLVSVGNLVDGVVRPGVCLPLPLLYTEPDSIQYVKTKSSLSWWPTTAPTVTFTLAKQAAAFPGCWNQQRPPQTAPDPPPPCVPSTHCQPTVLLPWFIPDSVASPYTSFLFFSVSLRIFSVLFVSAECPWSPLSLMLTFYPSFFLRLLISLFIILTPIVYLILVPVIKAWLVEASKSRPQSSLREDSSLVKSSLTGLRALSTMFLTDCQAGPSDGQTLLLCLNMLSNSKYSQYTWQVEEFSPVNTSKHILNITKLFNLSDLLT